MNSLFVNRDYAHTNGAMQQLVDTFGGNVAAFFGNQNGLKMYVGGDETGTETFAGYLYSFGISTNFNETEIENHFLSLFATASDNKFFTNNNISNYILLLICQVQKIIFI